MAKLKKLKLPYSKSLYAEHTDKHFKLYCPIQEQSVFVNIYLQKNKNKKIPYVFEEYMRMYEEKGMSQIEAATKAQESLNEFFDVCSNLSKKKIRPFKLRIVELDTSRIEK